MRAYKVEHHIPGRIRISSLYLKHIDIPQENIESFIKSQEGILDAKLNKKAGSLTIEYDPQKIYIEEFLELLEDTPVNFILDLLSSYKPQKIEKEEDGDKSRMYMGAFGVGTALLSIPFPFVRPIAFGINALASFPSFKKAFKNMFKKKKLSFHILDSLALGITLSRGMYLSAGSMNLLIGLGDYIEDKLNKKAEKSIKELLVSDIDKAFVELEDGTKIEVNVEDLEKGQIVCVYPGNRIPVDGIVKEGKGSVNESTLTGEDKPVLKQVGSKVYAGTSLIEGKLYIETINKGADTVISKIAEVVQSYMNSKPMIYDKFNKIADKTVLPLLLLSGAVYFTTRDLIKTSSILIIDYNTNLRVSIPVAMASSISAAASNGVVIKGGITLENLSKVDCIALDKTGTITKGEPVVVDIIPLEDISDLEILRLSASLEQRLNHPIAQAIVELAKSLNLELLEREDSQYDIGLGIQGKLNGELYYFGSTKYMNKLKIPITKDIKKIISQRHAEGQTLLYLAKDKNILGIITIRDEIRKEAKDVIRALKSIGIKKIVMLTGDNEDVASAIAKEVGVDEFRARIFPEDKAKIVENLKKEGYVVAMVGDGVNDSPALSVADVGIAMGDGAEIAIDVSDVVLIKENLWLIYESILLAKNTMKVTKNNINFNFLINTFGILLSLTNFSNPAISTAINNAGAVLSALYSLVPSRSFKRRDLC